MVRQRGRRGGDSDTQPLGVSIFGLLKAYMGQPTSEAAHIYDGQLLMADWASQMVRTREKVMTESNIKSGWRESGLCPFRSTKLVPVVIPASPLPHTPSPPTHTPLRSNQIDNRDLLAAHGLILTSPMKRPINALADGYGTAQTQLEMTRMEYNNRRSAQESSKKRFSL